MDLQQLSEKPTIAGFLRAFGGQWLTKMSGPLTVPFSIAAYFVPHTWAKALFGALAIVCAWVSAYKIWEVERKRINDLSARIQELEWPDNHPVIRVVRWGENPVPNSYYQKGFFLANSGPIALEVRIEDFMVGTHKWSSKIVAGIDSGAEALRLPGKLIQDC